MNYVFDVDGTLSFNGTRIEPDIIASIKELERMGNQIIFASARPIRDLVPIIPAFQHNLLIGGNGAIVSKADAIEVMSPISDNDFNYLKRLMKTYNLEHIVDGKWNYSAQVSSENTIIRQLDPDGLAKNIPIEGISNPIKVILLGIDEQRMSLITNMIRANTELELVEHVGERNLDMTAKGINKSRTLDLLGIDQYIAFGNDMNDIKMLSGAIKSFWVKSKPDLSAQASTFDAILEPDQVSSAIQSLCI
ncbi:HAD superfamily hydrolase [Levilactobacillus senmaizukei DSM 21775 = NBRC 103853]|uniref:HAD superfamily hydrolase n=1 Tax=Levilactobacillus senmaizukei DSM 21775 = NBRC 103853 TaxID=1423803 RepID=A0A0R2DMY3_9LACO|nr:HAD hydrolase family protein [Levilactobacillus senmaizukei]KRN01546.1 HAD superfamily hydrolase [Levilactobacillus senmaizukei DSM 21775 = NBRC 103853]